VTAPFATELVGWKPSSKNKLAWPLVPNFADVDNAESMRIAAGVLDVLAVDHGCHRTCRRIPADPWSRPFVIISALLWPAATPTVAGGSAGDCHHRFRSVRTPQRGPCAGPRQSRAADHHWDGLPDQAGCHRGARQRANGLGPAAAACGHLVQVDDPQRPGAEHPPRVPADDPSPARPPAASGDGDPPSRCRAGWRRSPGAPARSRPRITSPTTRLRPA
jgi:hypothetical protein